MHRDPLATSNPGIPQTRPIPGREADMLANNAGGYSFRKDDLTQLDDFLILGSAGGTYYCNQHEVTLRNLEIVQRAITTTGPQAVAHTVAISDTTPARAPSNKPALYALAAALHHGDLDTRRAAADALPRVARTTDHLSSLVGYFKQIHARPGTAGRVGVSTGRLARRAIGSWFLADPPERVAFRAAKAMQRATPQGERFTLRDALRIAHPAAETLERRMLFGWIAGNIPPEQAAEHLPAVDQLLRAKAVTTVKQALAVIAEDRVPWEFLPDAMLREPAVWDALIDTIGQTALLRNLARMTRLGVLTPLADATVRATRRLTNAQALARGRIHPMDVWLAGTIYASGYSRPDHRRPPTTWAPTRAITDALDEAYDYAFGYTRPSGRRLLIAIDSSGSMTYAQVSAAGSPLGRAYTVANIMARQILRIEGPNAHVIDVDTSVHSSRLGARTAMLDILRWSPSGGGTDLSLPFTHALNPRLNLDGIIVFTDGETWAGTYSHPTQALARYRQQVNPAARAVIASMTPAGHSIGDPKDPGVLNIGGLDASLPQLITGFIHPQDGARD